MRSRYRSVTLLAIRAVALSAALVTTRNVETQGAQGSSGEVRRTTDGKPDFSGIWQAANEANWDLQAHDARPGMVTQQGVYPYDYARVPAAPVLALGAAGGVPASLGGRLAGGRCEPLQRKELVRPGGEFSQRCLAFD